MDSLFSLVFCFFKIILYSSVCLNFSVSVMIRKSWNDLYSLHTCLNLNLSKVIDFNLWLISRHLNFYLQFGHNSLFFLSLCIFDLPRQSIQKITSQMLQAMGTMAMDLHTTHSIWSRISFPSTTSSLLSFNIGSTKFLVNFLIYSLSIFNLFWCVDEEMERWFWRNI